MTILKSLAYFFKMHERCHSSFNNKLSWPNHIFDVKTNFMNKVGALKRMKYLPVKTLAEIYFKTIIPSVTYGILTWPGETVP